MRRPSSILSLSVLMCILACQFAAGDSNSLRSLVPAGVADVWVIRDTPKIFTRETLFEHINGQADLFLQYKCAQSIFATYQNNKNPDSVVSVDIYDMGDALHAFGIFSRFRTEESPGGLGLDSSLGDQYVFFYRGKYFVAVQASGAKANGLEQFAKTIDSKISDDSEPPREESYFPKDGLKPGSIEYFPQGLLGTEFLGAGFKALYIAEPGESRRGESQGPGQDRSLFLAVFRDPLEAARALELYHEDLSRKGSAEMGQSTLLGPKTLRGMDPYQGKIVVSQRGSLLVGALGFEIEGQGEEKLLELMNKLPPESSPP